MKKIVFIFLCFAAFVTKAQQQLTIDEKGNNLKSFYLSLNVENLWIANHHINWETGEPDEPDAKYSVRTHCSAFVAAACKRLNIYILRPPQHVQGLLANAQYDWLQSNEAANDGWKQINDTNNYAIAQQYANTGYVVVAVINNPIPKKSGHIALVMPSQISLQELEDSGPVVIMASTHNHNSISLRAGFKSHISSWPEHEILFFYNINLPNYSIHEKNS
jgi:hypothetical protein